MERESNIFKMRCHEVVADKSATNSRCLEQVANYKDVSNLSRDLSRCRGNAMKLRVVKLVINQFPDLSLINFFINLLQTKILTETTEVYMLRHYASVAHTSRQATELLTYTLRNTKSQA